MAHWSSLYRHQVRWLLRPCILLYQLATWLLLDFPEHFRIHFGDSVSKERLEEWIDAENRGQPNASGTSQKIKPIQARISLIEAGEDAVDVGLARGRGPNGVEHQVGKKELERRRGAEKSGVANRLFDQV